MLAKSDGCRLRLNIELDLQSLLGLHVTWCAQLFSLAETPHRPHLVSYTWGAIGQLRKTTSPSNSLDVGYLGKMIVQREDCNQDKRKGAEAHQTNLIHRLLWARSLLQTYMYEHAQAARSYTFAATAAPQNRACFCGFIFMKILRSKENSHRFFSVNLHSIGLNQFGHYQGRAYTQYKRNYKFRLYWMLADLVRLILSIVWI